MPRPSYVYLRFYCKQRDRFFYFHEGERLTFRSRVLHDKPYKTAAVLIFSALATTHYQLASEWRWWSTTCSATSHRTCAWCRVCRPRIARCAAPPLCIAYFCTCAHSSLRITVAYVNPATGLPKEVQKLYKFAAVDPVAFNYRAVLLPVSAADYSASVVACGCTISPPSLSGEVKPHGLCKQGSVKRNGALAWTIFWRGCYITLAASFRPARFGYALVLA